MNPKKKESCIHKPKVSMVWEMKTVLRCLYSCIHSFPNKYGRVYAGALLVNTFGGIKTQITLHMLIIGGGTISSTNPPSSCLVVMSFLSQSDTRV